MATVLVTGASSGIGAAAVNAFATAGYQVVAAVRDPANVAGPWPVGVTPVVIDVRDPASVRAGVGAAQDAAGGALDVVVNNAGVAAIGPVESADLAAAQDLFDTNLWGAVRVAQAALPAMRAAGGGLVANISSVGGRTPARGFQAFYAASKHALRCLSEALVWELGPFGVRVVLVEPGFVATNIFDRARFESAPRPGGPYARAEDEVRRFFLRGAATMAVAPSVVAERLVALAADPAPALYQPVGADAVAGIETARSAATFEAWLAAAQRRVAEIAALDGPPPEHR